MSHQITMTVSSLCFVLQGKHPTKIERNPNYQMILYEQALGNIGKENSL